MVSIKYSVEIHNLKFVYSWSYGSDETRFEPATPDECVIVKALTKSGDNIIEFIESDFCKEAKLVEEILDRHYDGNPKHGTKE